MNWSVNGICRNKTKLHL